MSIAFSSRRLVLLAALGSTPAFVSSCVRAHTTPLAPLTQVVVKNDGFFDVNIAVVPSPGGRPTRLGTVVGATSASFPLRAADLQYGQYLVVSR